LGKLTFVDEDSDISIQANEKEEMKKYFNNDEVLPNFTIF